MCPAGSFPREAVDSAAAAFFSAHHLERLKPLLAATSRSHPRLHPLWGHLLALLVPGFHPHSVRTPCTAGLPPPTLDALPILYTLSIRPPSSSHLG